VRFGASRCPHCRASGTLLSRLQILPCEHAKAPALAWVARVPVGQHGGSILINSKENMGTTVPIELPLSQRKRAAA
jgi:hypothetical protein